METGIRPVELYTLLVRDIDIQQRLIYPTTAKNGAPRKIKISQALTDLIQAYINKNQRKLNEPLFRGNPVSYGKEFREVRNRLANKLSDESLKTVRLYDLRHYFATMDYHKFQDLKRTQYLMGHKHSSTTDIYTHLIDSGEENEYTCKTAANTKEATALIETGFQYVTTIEGIQLFKKRK
jgi:integrase